MLNKQFGALHFFILAAILAATILIGLGTIFFLDRALIARTASQRDTQNSPSERALANDETTVKPTLGAAKNLKENAEPGTSVMQDTKSTQ